jgi:catechol 2,3-dioxygenase
MIPRHELRFGRPPPGYRLPEATALGPVRLQVADLARSLSFYGEVLGLRVMRRRAGFAELGAEAGSGEAPALLGLHERRGVAPVPREGRLGLYHYALLVPDRAALGRFAAHLGRLGIRPGAADHLVSEALYLHDPDGLGIEVYADRPREVWKRENGQLLMDTRRLELEELVRAGNGQPWAGMPAGSTVGHVHLHVGDLEAASAFYHDGLGFDRTVWSYPGALFLSAGGYHHHVGVNTWAARAKRTGPDDAGLLEWELRLPSAGDAREALRSLDEAGYPVTPMDDGGTAKDPWDIALRIRTAEAA